MNDTAGQNNNVLPIKLQVVNLMQSCVAVFPIKTTLFAF